MIDEPLLARIRALAHRIHPRHNMEGHILPVVQISLELAQELDTTDISVVEAAAYLHDAGRVRFGCYRHDVTGSIYVDWKLRQYHVPRAAREHIVSCVRTHRGTKEHPPQSIEAEIVANADALSHFECILYEFGIHYSHTHSVRKTSEWYKTKCEYDLARKLTIPGARTRAIHHYTHFVSPLLSTLARYVQ